MQYLQLQLTRPARAWLKQLPRNSFDSWGDFECEFIQNFRETYKRPTTIEQLCACKQRFDESIRTYIQRWNILKNDSEDFCEESAVEDFKRGLRRTDSKEELGRLKPRAVAHLMEIANRWADGEDSIRNEHNLSPDQEDMDAQYLTDGGRRYDRNGERRRKRKNRPMTTQMESRWSQLDSRDRR